MSSRLPISSVQIPKNLFVSNPLKSTILTKSQSRPVNPSFSSFSSFSTSSSKMTSPEILSINSTFPIPSSSSSSSTNTNNNNNKIPRLGFGVYKSSGETCYNACLTALRAGYRHIDSAQYYANETQVGRAVRDSGIPREEVYLTTKILGGLGPHKDNVEKTYESLVRSVERMNCLEEGTLSSSSKDASEDASAGAGEGKGEGAAAAAEKKKKYVDLFLIHSPFSGEVSRRTMWLALERAKKNGLAREIGVSNYGRKYIEEMKAFGASVFPPAVNQIELHPWCQQRTAVSYCAAQNIIIEAYCPIVRNRKADDPTLLSIIKANHPGRTTAQVLIRYSLQKGWVPLPKSDTPERVKANADVYDFELSKEDMDRLDGLDQGDKGAIVCAVEN